MIDLALCHPLTLDQRMILEYRIQTLVEGKLEIEFPLTKAGRYPDMISEKTHEIINGQKRDERLISGRKHYCYELLHIGLRRRNSGRRS